MKSIGFGSYSTVYVLTKKYALKKTTLDTEENDNFINILNELNVLAFHSNSSICSFRNFFQFKNEFCMVLDRCNMNLEKFFSSEVLYFQNNQNKIDAISQLCSGLDFLHSNNILHLDIKEHNILVSLNSGRPKFIYSDFGLSKICKDKIYKSCGVLITVTHRPIENILGSCKYSKKSDVWSLGIIFYRIIECKKIFKYPFSYYSKINSDRNSFGILFEFQKLKSKNKWPPTKNEVIRRMLESEVSKRASIKEILNLLNIENEKVVQQKYKRSIQNKIMKTKINDLMNNYYKKITKSEYSLIRNHIKVKEEVSLLHFYSNYYYSLFLKVCERKKIKEFNEDFFILLCFELAKILNSYCYHNNFINTNETIIKFLFLIKN